MVKQTYNYEVKFHFINGSDIIVRFNDQELPKEQFIFNMTTYRFISVDPDNTTTINMRTVLYMEVKEMEAGKDV